MGRPSKLSERRWTSIERRVLDGEPVRKLAREFGIGEATIRDRISAHVKPLKRLAEQIAKVEDEFAALPLSAQVRVRGLVDIIHGTMTHLVTAAESGAMVARRMSHIARVQSEQLDELALLDESVDGAPSNATHLRSIAAMTDAANNAAKIGLGLLSSNKELLRSAGKKTDITPVTIPYDPIEATRVYMAMIHGVGRP